MQVSGGGGVEGLLPSGGDSRINLAGNLTQLRPEESAHQSIDCCIRARLQPWPRPRSGKAVGIFSDWIGDHVDDVVRVTKLCPGETQILWAVSGVVRTANLCTI